MDFMVSSDILCELLEVSIHLILYTRKIYPAIAFKRRKKYNIPVQIAIFPKLKSYISDCVNAIKPHLERGKVKKVVIGILSSDGNVLEKFVFEINQLPLQPEDLKNDVDLQKFEESLRAFCLKLSITDSLLKPLPSECSFCIQILLPEDEAKTTTNQVFPWIVPDDSQIVLHNSHIVPLKSMNSESCHMQLYVEETMSK